MAGYLLPLFLDLLRGGAGGSGGTYGPSVLSTSAQDTSADSNVFNTHGPSGNHGSISFNFNVNHENFSSPLGKTAIGARGQHQMDELLRQNDLLKQIIGRIAPSIIPSGTRTKRSIRRRPWTFPRRDGRPNLGIRCFRPSPMCPPRGPFGGYPTTTQRPFAPPLSILRAEQETPGQIAGKLEEYYMKKLSRKKVNPLPKAFQLALYKFYGLKPINKSLGSNSITDKIEGK